MSYFNEIIEDIISVCQFEQWIRHYFTVNSGADNYILIPDDKLEKIKTSYDSLANIALEMNNKPISIDNSRFVVMDYIKNNFDGIKYKPNVVASVLDDSQFQIQLQLFGIWVEIYDATLDNKIYGFTEWKKLFIIWKNSEEGQQVALSMSVQSTTVENNSTN